MYVQCAARLHAAALGGHQLQRRCLRSHVDAVERECGQTPLHCAVGAGSVDCVSVLLSAGADAGVRRPDGCTPLGLARAVSWCSLQRRGGRACAARP